MTEQEKYGMDQLLKYLEMQINLKSDRIRMYKKQMDSNYLYYFAWAGKDLFKAYYMIEKYKELRQVLKKAKRPEEVHEYLQTERGKCVRELVNGPIYIHYSDEIFNLAHSYRTECTQQLIQDYNGFGQLLSLEEEEEEEEEEASPSKGENRNRAGNNEKEVERIKNVKHETGQLEY